MSTICDSIFLDIFLQIVWHHKFHHILLDDAWFYAARNTPIWYENTEVHHNVDNHIQNWHLGRYIIIYYKVRNQVLRLCLLVAVRLNIGPYIRGYTSPNENFEHNYSLSTTHDPIRHIGKCQKLKKHHTQEISPSPVGDHKAARNRRDSVIKANEEHK